VLMVMPVGGESRAKVSGLSGMSESVAEAETFKAVCSLTARSPGTVNCGGTLISLTVATNELVALKAGVPLSVTLTTTVLLEGPSASDGVHAIAPAEETVSPPGPDTSA